MLQALITFAAEESEPSKVPFYIAGGILAAYAVLLSALGISRRGFPANKTQGRGVMALSAVLVVAAMATAVLTG